MTEFRALEGDETIQFQQAWEYGFQFADGPTEYHSPNEIRDRVGELRGLFDQGELVGVCQLHPFHASIRGEDHPIGGVASIVILPEHRGNGFGRQLLEKAINEFADRDRIIALLWPFNYPYYRSAGWGQIERRHRYSVPPSSLPSNGGNAVEITQAGPDDIDQLNSIYRGFSAEYTLAIDRSMAWWHNVTFGGTDPDRYAFLFEHDGDGDGYLLMQGEDDGDTLTVTDMAYTDPDILDAFYGFLHRHASQVDRIILEAPTPIGLLDAVAKPETVSYSVHLGAMGRIVSVKSCLEALSFPDISTDRISLAIDDPLRDDPVGIAFSLENGVSHWEAIPPESAAIRVGVRTLSQLVVGYYGVAEARRHGELDGPQRALKSLDRAFPQAQTYVPDRF